MGAFARAVARWHDFSSVIGTASATLVGLLFGALSIHLDKVAQSRHRGLRAAAGQTFSGFLVATGGAWTLLALDAELARNRNESTAR